MLSFAWVIPTGAIWAIFEIRQAKKNAEQLRRKKRRRRKSEASYSSISA